MWFFFFNSTLSITFSARGRHYHHLPARDRVHIQTPNWRGAASLQGAHSRQVLLPELPLDVQRERAPQGHRGVIVGMRSTLSYPRSDTYTLCWHFATVCWKLYTYITQGVVTARGQCGLLFVTSYPGQLSEKCWADGCGSFDTCSIWVLISPDFIFL